MVYLNELKAENRTLRQALEAVEWNIVASGEDNNVYDDCCPGCYNHKAQGHAPDCIVGYALGRFDKNNANGGDKVTDDKFLDEMGGEWLDGSGFEDEPENAPECSDDYPHN